jgi:hypothetical protein
VRISIDPDQALAARLRPGMSVVASIDTKAGGRVPPAPGQAAPAPQGPPAAPPAGQPGGVATQASPGQASRVGQARPGASPADVPTRTPEGAVTSGGPAQ